MDTEKDGAVQSDSIENKDVVQEAVEGTPKEATKAPEVDDVQKWGSFNKLISEREKAAEEKAAKHFQSVKDKEVAAEKRLRLEAEKTAKLNQAHIEAQRELLLSGLTDPQERAEAERRYNAHVARKQEELNKPSPEQMAEFQRMQVVAEDAKYQLRRLRDDYDIDIDLFNLKTSDKRLDLSTPDTALETARTLIKELKGGKKAEPKAEEPKEPKKAPTVHEGGGRSSGKRNYTREEIANMTPEQRRPLMDDITRAYGEGRVK